ncbi:hypothetical protein ACI2I3_06505 [Psychrobacter namhaensis]|uniref:Uncharacterized protein n=1 Tax=Psychrobacter namhaensis TaxID=292734 RepID=A0ABW8LAQ6_9GAMM
MTSSLKSKRKKLSWDSASNGKDRSMSVLNKCGTQACAARVGRVWLSTLFIMMKFS